ncbi:MAG: type I phosphomannose isomerase catalytic subunit [Chloroflexota bacterium]
MTDTRIAPLPMAPDLRVRPWAGDRLAPADRKIGEAWLAGPASTVAAGPFAGRSLDDLAHELGTDLVGTRGLVHGRGGFPVLVKLIDAAEWLSIQVHPDDEEALAIEGEPGIGKSEAWLVLDSAPDAALLLGPRAGVAPRDLVDALGTAALPDLLARIPVSAGDCIDVPAGTLHAIGPGVFVYEIQQPCDITYRAWDWGRTDRTVHTQQSKAVTDGAAAGRIERAPAEERSRIVAASPFFTARQLLLTAGGTDAATDGTSPHVITLLDGEAELHVAGAAGGTAPGATLRLAPHDTVVLPAVLGAYRLVAAGAGTARAVVATVP